MKQTEVGLKVVGIVDISIRHSHRKVVITLPISPIHSHSFTDGVTNFRLT
jgi:hypothetical protein